MKDLQFCEICVIVEPGIQDTGSGMEKTIRNRNKRPGSAKLPGTEAGLMCIDKGAGYSGKVDLLIVQFCIRIK